jgi:hypothetical protein
MEKSDREATLANDEIDSLTQRRTAFMNDHDDDPRLRQRRVVDSHVFIFADDENR